MRSSNWAINRMLKKAASFVLASLRGSTYRKEYAFASSLAAASLTGLFEHPVGRRGMIHKFFASR